MRYRGTVRRWHNERGYGFLARPGARDLFVHVSQLQVVGYKCLTEGEEVEFSVDVDQKHRECAVDVVPLGTVPDSIQED